MALAVPATVRERSRAELARPGVRRLPRFWTRSTVRCRLRLGRRRRRTGAMPEARRERSPLAVPQKRRSGTPRAPRARSVPLLPPPRLLLRRPEVEIDVDLGGEEPVGFPGLQ